MPKVSIIIPFYNCPFIDQAIESALNQTYKDIEIIVINDGSSTHTEKVTPYKDRIQYYEKENGGTGSALNLGIQNAAGNYFSWLSSDDLFSDQKVERQLSFMEKEKAQISYTNYYVMDAYNNTSVKMAGKAIHTKMELLKYLQKDNPINGCTVMMDMDVFSTIGLFNETLKCTQDYDFWLRAIDQYEFHYLHEPLVSYRVHHQMTPQRNNQLAKEITLLNTTYDGYLEKLIKQEKEKNPPWNPFKR
ncbi:glycosyltransferase family 2 protein [Fictibacillus iocasae]|uniref:Glycosyltransferase family 2 protein n=1 Tax=Fictibacillus iocasae TaxID=2715437 RepID=A0ABW2NPS2_9BACL